MPDISTIPAQDYAQLKALGYTDAEITASPGPQQQAPQQSIGKLATIADTLKAHAGGILGGGGGAIGATALGVALAPETGGLSLAIPILAGAVGAGAGGYAGQKAQQAIESPETYEAQQNLAQQAAQQNPITAGATDIGASALASGGMFSPTTAIKGIAGIGKGLIGRGLSDEAKNVLFQSAINPTIGTGLSLAQGQGIPSGTDLLGQAAGGTLFAKSWLPHGRLPSEPSEPSQETGNSDSNTSQGVEEGYTQPVQSPFNAQEDDGTYKIGNKQIKNLYLRQFAIPVKEIKDPIAKAMATTANDKLQSLSPDIMRQQLHDRAAQESVQNDTQDDPEYQGGEMPLTHGDFVQATMPDGTSAEGHVIGADENGNAQIIKEDGTLTSLPETYHANQIKSPVEAIRSQTPEPTTPVAEGKPSGLPESTQLSETEKEGLQKELEESGDVVNSPLSDYNRYIELVSQLEKTKSLDAAQPLQKELEEIKNRNGGMPPRPYPENHVLMPVALQARIMSNRATTGSVLQGLANTEGHPLQELAQHLLDASDTKSLGVHWFHNPNLDKGTGQRSHYDPRSDQVNIGTGSAGDARVVMEEAIHSMTSKKIPEFGNTTGTEHWIELNKYLKNGSNDTIKDLIKSYLDTAKHLGIEKQLFHNEVEEILPGDKLSIRHGAANDPDEAVKRIQGFGHTTKYAMGNLHEFIAQAIKDPQFQRVLEQIPTSDGRNIWQKIVDSVRKLLGLSAKDETMLNRVLRSSGELVNQSRPETGGPFVNRHIAPADDAESALRNLQNDIETHFKKMIEQAKKSGDMIKAGKLQEALDVMPRMEGNVKHNTPPKQQDATAEELRNLKKIPTPDSQQLPKDKYMGKIGTVTRAVIDKIRDINTPQAKLVGDSMQRALDRETELKGKWKNAIVQAGEGLSTFDKRKLMDVFNKELETKQHHMGMLTNAAQRKFYLAARAKLDESGKYRLNIGEPVTQTISKNGKNVYVQRNLKQDQTYFPGMANQKVMQVYRNATDHEAMATLDKQFHDYNTKTLGMSEGESKERINNFKTALQGSLKNSDISHQDYFNAHRKAQGTPLPPSFREQDPVRNLERYFDRAAVDASHYEYMEKNHDVLSALGQTKDAWNKPVNPSEHSLANNPAVKSGLQHWKGEAVSPAEGNEHSLSSLLSSGFIAGPALEVHKVVSNVVKSLASTSNPLVMMRAITHALTNINAGYQHAVENGVVKLTARSAKQMIDGSSTAAERLQSLARIIRRVSTLNDLTTKVGGGLVQAMNEVIIPSKVLRANSGNVSDQLFIKRLDPTYTKGKEYTPEELQQLASRSANYIHGTGDIRSLPAWMLNDSEFSGFFSLAHWSIAQTNNFMKEVYEPATRGDIAPLLTGMFGAAIGGYIIKELRQDIQGKKSPIPSLQEIAASDKGIEGNPGLIGYNMISALQYAGFGGLLSQVAKYPFDFAYKNTPQGATFPMDEVATDMASTLHNVSSTIANDPNLNWVDLAQAVTMHILSTNFQLGRIAVNQGINNGLITGLPAEKKELSDKMGQLRRFDMVEGLPYQDIDEGSNPYLNLEMKRFKSTQDLGEAVKQLPSLISNIFETYKGTPDVLLSKLKALKENEYSTFPSIENMPISFFKYLNYLTREEGSEAAQNELKQYMLHKTTNEVKASIIP